MENVPKDGHPKCNKNEKKTQRKLTRLINEILKSDAIEISESPTKFLMIANAGMVTGVKSEEVLFVFSEFGKVDAVTIAPGKKYTFVTFSDEDHSRAAVEAIHGKLLPNLKSPWYLVYVKQIHSVPEQMSEQLPSDLILIPDFITIETERELNQLISWENENGDNAVLKHRQVKHFGYQFCYDTNNVDINQPLDEVIPQLCLKVLDNLSVTQQLKCIPDQLTVNRYLPGQGIPLHVDTHSAFEDEILSLSIGSAVVMNFQNPDGRHKNVYLPPRSLLIMKGESRYAWKHGISPRKSDVVTNNLGECVSSVSHRCIRISFTFRKVRCRPCQCNYPTLCDSQSVVKTEPQHKPQFIDDEEKFENSHVHQVYDVIAGHFSSTRYKPWPKITDFLKALPIGSLLLDVGCGNGKYLNINANIFNLGCDRSTKLLSICNERGYDSFRSDALSLPIRSSSFDVCICIAVIHHLSTIERRLKTINEISRVLVKGGKALIYVWSVDQSADGKRSNYINNSKVDNSVPQTQSPIPIHTNRSQFQHRDLFVPWKLKGKEVENEGAQPQTLYRYYHMFEKGELEKLCEMDESLQLIERYYDKGNWCVVVEKT